MTRYAWWLVSGHRWPETSVTPGSSPGWHVLPFVSLSRAFFQYCNYIVSIVLSKENVIVEESESPPKMEKTDSIDSGVSGSTTATLGLVRHKMQNKPN